jgi:hypothetical protein
VALKVTVALVAIRIQANLLGTSVSESLMREL